jgi:hypothetical protein
LLHRGEANEVILMQLLGKKSKQRSNDVFFKRAAEAFVASCWFCRHYLLGYCNHDPKVGWNMKNMKRPTAVETTFA